MDNLFISKDFDLSLIRLVGKINVKIDNYKKKLAAGSFTTESEIIEEKILLAQMDEAAQDLCIFLDYQPSRDDNYIHYIKSEVKSLNKLDLDKFSTIDYEINQLIKAINHIMPLYNDTAGGKGSVFIKKFINSITHDELVNISQIDCLSDDNFNAVITILKGYKTDYTIVMDLLNQHRFNK